MALRQCFFRLGGRSRLVVSPCGLKQARVARVSSIAALRRTDGQSGFIPAPVTKASLPIVGHVRHFSKKGKKKKAVEPSEDEDLFEEGLDFEILRGDVNNVVEHLEKDFSRLRAGGADAKMLDGINVDAYGSSVPLSQLGQIQVKSPKLMVMTVFDPSIAPKVKDAIVAADMNLNPLLDGGTVQIPVPKTTAETRQNLIKVAGKEAEKAKQHLRRIRRDNLDELKAMKSLSEDIARREQKEVDAVIQQGVKQVTDMLEAKTKSLSSV